MSSEVQALCVHVHVRMLNLEAMGAAATTPRLRGEAGMAFASEAYGMLGILSAMMVDDAFEDLFPSAAPLPVHDDLLAACVALEDGTYRDARDLTPDSPIQLRQSVADGYERLRQEIESLVQRYSDATAFA